MCRSHSTSLVVIMAVKTIMEPLVLEWPVEVPGYENESDIWVAIRTFPPIARRIVANAYFERCRDLHRDLPQPRRSSDELDRLRQISVQALDEILAELGYE